MLQSESDHVDGGKHGSINVAQVNVKWGDPSKRRWRLCFPATVLLLLCVYTFKTKLKLINMKKVLNYLI